MSMSRPIVPQLDVPTFLAWEAAQRERHELHHGFVVGFAGGSMDHDRIAFNMRSALEAGFPSPCRSFGSDVKVRVSADSVYYADAGIVCDETSGAAVVVERPRVVAEVLSPRTRSYDIIEKRAAYRALPSLEAYVIVHTDARRVEVDSRSLDGTWHTATYDDDDGAIVNALVIPLDDVYRRSSLDVRS
jgi:Uma2 family endonuclease